MAGNLFSLLAAGHRLDRKRQLCQGRRRIFPILRLARMGGRSFHINSQSLGGTLGNSGFYQHLPLGIAAHIMKGEHPADALFPDQPGAFLSSAANFLPVLENKVHRPVRAEAVRLQRQSAERGAVSVMAALMADAGIFRSIGKPRLLFHRKRVHIRPEGDGLQLLIFPVRVRVKIMSPIFYEKLGILPQKLHQPSFSFPLLHGKLRMGMKLMPQSFDLFQIFPIHLLLPSILVFCISKRLCAPVRPGV